MARLNLKHQIRLTCSTLAWVRLLAEETVRCAGQRVVAALRGAR